MKEKNSLLLICLNEGFGKAVASELANKLDKVFVDCSQQISQNLFDKEVNKAEANLDFLQKQEKDCLKKCAKFENSTIYITYNLYTRNKDIFKKLQLCYLQLPIKALDKKDVLSKIDFEHRDKVLADNAKQIIKLETTNLQEAIDKIKVGGIK